MAESGEDKLSHYEGIALDGGATYCGRGQRHARWLVAQLGKHCNEGKRKPRDALCRNLACSLSLSLSLCVCVSLLSLIDAQRQSLYP
jgi:hypothetical protein